MRWRNRKGWNIAFLLLSTTGPAAQVSSAWTASVPGASDPSLKSSGGVYLGIVVCYELRGTIQRCSCCEKSRMQVLFPCDYGWFSIWACCSTGWTDHIPTQQLQPDLWMGQSPAPIEALCPKLLATVPNFWPCEVGTHVHPFIHCVCGAYHCISLLHLKSRTPYIVCVSRVYCNSRYSYSFIYSLRADATIFTHRFSSKRLPLRLAQSPGINTPNLPQVT